MNFRALLAAIVATAANLSICLAVISAPAHSAEPWSPQDVVTISSLRLKEAGKAPADPSNAYAESPDAIAPGRALFNDPRFSANGKVSCASCHAAGSQFGDALPRGQGIGSGRRRTMPLMGAMYSPFLFWDGRKDSLWSQALGPMEDALEHGSNRVGIATLVMKHYRDDYEKVFGPMPDLQSLPAAASPAGSIAEREAWARLPEDSRTRVNRVYANMGKAIAAFERTITYGESRFDRYADAVAAGDEAGQQVLSPQEARGLRVFLTNGQCITCHNGPMLTDHAFHNTGVPQANSTPDRGRYEGISKLLRDEFNCLGPYSDARPEQCTELAYLAAADASQLGSFRTPSLRNVSLRPPYMHAGQFTTLEQVIAHYVRAPAAAVGRSELAARSARRADRIAVRMTSTDARDLTAFLQALNGPVNQPGE
jgi:cytochrome c peroxidase